MAHKKFRLLAQVSSDDSSAIKPCLERIIGNKGTIRETGQGFNVEAEFEGESAAALNRMILSELRRVEKRTRIRSEWASGDTIERFFDYVPKETRHAQGK
jgi:hypothetical protein